MSFPFPQQEFSLFQEEKEPSKPFHPSQPTQPSPIDANILHSVFQEDFQNSLSVPSQCCFESNPPQQIQELFQSYYLDYLSKHNIPLSYVAENSIVNQGYAIVNVPVTIPVKIPLQQSITYGNNNASGEHIIEPLSEVQINQPTLDCHLAPPPQTDFTASYQSFDTIRQRAIKLMHNPVPGISFDMLLSTVLNK